MEEYCSTKSGLIPVRCCCGTIEFNTKLEIKTMNRSKAFLNFRIMVAPPDPMTFFSTSDHRLSINKPQKSLRNGYEPITSIVLISQWNCKIS